MSRCEDCGAEHAPRVDGHPCPCCADAPSACTTPCPGCGFVPADGEGFYVTLYVSGPRTQEAAELAVDAALRGVALDGATADVVPE